MTVSFGEMVYNTRCFVCSADNLSHTEPPKEHCVWLSTQLHRELGRLPLCSAVEATIQRNTSQTEGHVEASRVLPWCGRQNTGYLKC